MKFTYALVGLVGVSNAAILARSFATLGNGMYTIPIVNNTLDFKHATREPEDVHISNGGHGGHDGARALEERLPPGTCDPQLPTRTTTCRSRRIERPDYLRAYAKFLDWVETGPDEGWIPKNSCKSLLWEDVVVNACSTGGPNPTCREEVVEAMRELDTYCALDQGGVIAIRKWRKSYGRHNIRDGDNLDTLFVFDDGDDKGEDPEQHHE